MFPYVGIISAWNWNRKVIRCTHIHICLHVCIIDKRDICITEKVNKIRTFQFQFNMTTSIYAQKLFSIIEIKAHMRISKCLRWPGWMGREKREEVSVAMSITSVLCAIRCTTGRKNVYTLFIHCECVRSPRWWWEFEKEQIKKIFKI